MPIIVENFPQLCIQIWYTFDRGSNVDIVAVWAFISSMVSIFIAVIDVYSSQALVKAMKAAEKENKHFRGHSYFMEILGEEIEDKKRMLMMKPNAIRRVFGEVLEIDHRCIELTLCLSIPHGMQFGFTLYTADRKKVTRHMRLQRIYNSIKLGSKDFIFGVRSVWNLTYDKDPIITNIETIYQLEDELEKEEFENDCSNIEISEFHRTHPWVYNIDKV